MDEALKTRLKEFLLFLGILLGAYFAIPEIWEQISVHSYSLGGWRYLLYFLVICMFLTTLVAGVVFIIREGMWILKETIHFLGTVWKSIIHGEIREYTTLVTQDARELEEKKRRCRQRKEFLLQQRTEEENNEYELAYGKFFQEGIKIGREEGEKLGYADGYNNLSRLDNVIDRMKEGESYGRII